MGVLGRFGFESLIRGRYEMHDLIAMRPYGFKDRVACGVVGANEIE